MPRAVSHASARTVQDRTVAEAVRQAKIAIQNDLSVTVETATTVAWSGVTGTPTTLAGYGIADAYTKTTTDGLLAATLATAETYADGVGAATLATAEAYTDSSLAAFVGTANIATVGTITSGVWSGTVVTTAYGGTGLASWTAGDLPYYAAGTLLSKLAIGTSTYVLTSSGAAPQWSANLAYGVLPSGAGAWDTGAATTLTITRSLTVSGTLTGTLTGSITGNAATATALATARAINGVDFDGTAAITVTAAAGTLTGTTLNATVVSSSLTSVGTLAGLTVTATITGSVSGNAATATNVAASGITGTTLAANVVTSSLTTVGTIVAGAIPASLVTPGTFGAGGPYTFPDYLRAPYSGIFGQTSNGRFRIEGTGSITDPTVAGPGIEMWGDEGGTSYILVYNRTTAARYPLTFDALSYYFAGGVATTFTGTLAVTGAATFNASGNAIIISAALARTTMTSTTGTNAVYHSWTNSGSTGYVGAESSVAGGIFTGSSAYATVFYTTATDIQIIRGGTGVTTFGATGVTTSGTLAVTGVLSANAGVTVSTGTFASGKIYKDATIGLTIGSITGSTHDFYLVTPTGSGILNVPTGTNTVGMVGAATIGGTLAVTGTATVPRIVALHTSNPFLQLSKTDVTARSGFVEIAGDDFRLYYEGAPRLLISATGAVEVPGTLAVTGALTASARVLATGDITFAGISSGSVGSIGLNATSGLLVIGKTGTVYDFLLANGVGTAILYNTTGTTSLIAAGTFAATSFYSTILDSNAASDLLLKRNNVTQLTLGSSLATFVGVAAATAFYSTVFDSNAASDLLLKRNNVTLVTVGASALTIAENVEAFSYNVSAAEFRFAYASSQAQITADQNDYAGCAVGSFFQLTSNAARTITGMTGGVLGRVIWIYNAGAYAISFANQSASSSASNRVITGTGATRSLNPGLNAMFIWESLNSRWHWVA